MPPNDDDPKEQNKKNIRADPGIFDKLFELFGVKEKPGKEEENRKSISSYRSND